MAEPFIGEIRMAGFNFAPRGWALCDGQTLPIDQNQALFSILGTTYGGNGRTDFRLPDLRGRAPRHVGTGAGLDTVSIGGAGGSETETLSVQEMPAHDHDVRANSGAGTTPIPSANASLASHTNGYAPSATAATTHPANTLSSVGGGQAHTNMQPFGVVNYIIAIVGVFPSRN